MDLTDIHKFCFPFNWFIDTYDKINGIGTANNFDENIKNKINQIYIEEHLNYSKFIDKIEILLNISSNDKIKFLEKEIKCKLCKQHYPYNPYSFEIFTKYIDWITKKNLNSMICFNCACSQYFCSNCDCKIELGESIYIYTNENFKYKFLTICETCYFHVQYTNEQMPLFFLFYKDIKINIEFNDINNGCDECDECDVNNIDKENINDID